jgi:hypothetical protein
MADARRGDGYERRDVRLGPVWIVVFGFFVLTLVVGLLLGAMTGVFRAAREPGAPLPVETREVAQPGPRLQADPSQDLAAFRAEKRALIERTGWVDREAGIARIPIEDAMRLLAERGWPSPVADDAVPAGWPEARR